MIYEIWTDASCKEHVGTRKLDIGVWGFIIVKNGKEHCRNSGIVLNTTVPGMELYSVYQGLFHAIHFLTNGKRYEVYSDASYVVSGANEWMFTWAANGWRRKSGRLANSELWKEFFHLNEKKQINYNWVPGKSKLQWNEEAHKLALGTLRNYIDNL